MTFLELKNLVRRLTDIPSTDDQMTNIISSELNNAQTHLFTLLVNAYPNDVSKVGSIFPSLIQTEQITASSGQITFTLNSNVFKVVNMNFNGRNMEWFNAEEHFREHYRPSYLNNDLYTCTLHGYTLNLDHAANNGVILEYTYLSSPVTMVNNSDVASIAEEHSYRLAYRAASVMSPVDGTTREDLNRQCMEGLILNAS